LVVDDNESVVRIATEILQNAGAAVLYARNAAEALDICENREIQIGLLVTDVVMPGRNGLQLAEELRLRYPAMRVLFMSGYADDIIGAGAGDLSGKSFLQKPFKEEVLLRKVVAIVAD
jgi:CheY-like chemotaxis protein